MTSVLDRAAAPSPAAALVCRNCGAAFPLGPQHACLECFGPLEIGYDADRRRGHPGGMSRTALSATRACYPSAKTRRRVDSGTDDALIRADRLAAESFERRCGSGRLGESDPLVQRPGGLGRVTRRRASFRARLRVDGNLGNCGPHAARRHARDRLRAGRSRTAKIVQSAIAASPAIKAHTTTSTACAASCRDRRVRTTASSTSTCARITPGSKTSA